MVGSVDFAPEQRGVCPVLFCFPNHLKRVECSPGGSAKNAHDNRRIVANELLKSLRTEIGDFEKNRPCANAGAGKQSRDAVVHKARNVGDRFYRSVGDKHFEKMSKVLLPSFFTERSI